MRAFYNEIDRYCCDWLQNLMDAGHITPGKIDDRSITELTGADVAGYERVHFFAGIAGWDYALQLAGWHGPIWTGSCPCQPFSVAGQQRGSEDERHLWPAFFRLIRECRPATVFGEQVAGAAGLAWLDHVCADLEGAGYAVAAADLPACSVGAPHRRQRLWWVADANDARLEGRRDKSGEHAGQFVAGPASPWRDLKWLPCADGKVRPTQPGLFPLAHGVSGRVGRLRAYGNAIVPQVAAEFISAVMECRP